MKSSTAIRALAVGALMSGAVSATAVAQPRRDATIHFGGGSVAFIAGVNWGGGTLHWRGRSIPLRVSGLGIGAIGATSYSAEGDVYHLHRLSDINGTYTAINASATAGRGKGWIDMENGNGVEIRAHSTSVGLKLSLAPTGVLIHIK